MCISTWGKTDVYAKVWERTCGRDKMEAERGKVQYIYTYIYLSISMRQETHRERVRGCGKRRCVYLYLYIRICKRGRDTKDSTEDSGSEGKGG